MADPNFDPDAAYQLDFELGKRHEASVQALSRQKLTIRQIIEALVKLYAELYECNAYQINCGRCEEFACDVQQILPGASAEWGDSLIEDGENEDQFAYHCVVLYQNRYYDSQHPEGVDDFRTMSAFQPSLTVQAKVDLDCGLAP